MEKEIDYKKLSVELAKRLAFALDYGKFSGIRIDMQTGKSQETMDYLADGIEMIPGLRVDRKRMRMSAKERQAYDKFRAKTKLTGGIVA